MEMSKQSLIQILGDYAEYTYITACACHFHCKNMIPFITVEVKITSNGMVE